MDSYLDAEEEKRWTLKQKDDRSRYTNDERIKYTNGLSIIETHDRVTISQNNSDKFYRVQVGFENRLDLIAWKFYDSPQYWWVIAYASNIVDPLNIPAGTLLRIPQLTRALKEVNKLGK